MNLKLQRKSSLPLSTPLSTLDKIDTTEPPLPSTTTVLKHLPSHISPNTPGLPKKNSGFKDAYLHALQIPTSNTSITNNTSSLSTYLLWTYITLNIISILSAIITIILKTVPIEYPCILLLLCAISGLILSYFYKKNLTQITASNLEFINNQKPKGFISTRTTPTNVKNSQKHKEQISLLSSFRKGDFHKQLEICSTEDLKQLLPVVAQSLCHLPFGLTEFRSNLFVILAKRITYDASLDQTWRFFLNSNHDLPDIIRTWENHEYFQSETGSYDAGSPIGTDYTRTSIQLSHAYSTPNTPLPSDINLNSVTFFRSLFKRLNKVGSYKSVSPDQRIYDPITGDILVKVQLKQIMPSNAKPYKIDCFTIEEKTFENPIWSSTILLKQGDDLRKDLGVMLMFKFMNELWKENGLNYNGQRCETLVYNVVPMAVDLGAIEFIDKATKISNIDSVLTEVRINDKLDTTMDRLIATSAASYVASYILGVRDRHNDNILIRDDGMLFNIDFSHILGEKLGGLDAAKVAIPLKFVKTIGNENWNRFMEISVLCFNVLRKRYIQLLDFARIVFAFMKCGEENERYLKKSLMVYIDDMEAGKLIRDKFGKAPSKLSTRMKNTIHTLAVIGKTKASSFGDSQD